MDQRYIFGVVDIFIIIYFISAKEFRLQNLPTDKSMLLKMILSMRAKRK